MDHQDVDAAMAEMLRVRGPHSAEDWTVPAGPLEWTCWQTAAHIGHDLLAYAGQLAAQPADAYLPIDLNVRPTASPAEVLQAVTACGGLLSSALATATPTLRAWHWGPCDPEGFAAMGAAADPGEVDDHDDILVTATGVAPHMLIHADRGDAIEPVLVIDQDSLASARTASLAVFHATPSPSATRATVRCCTTMASSAQRRPRRDNLARGSAARLVSWRHT
jgi:hypothetical protein